MTGMLIKGGTVVDGTGAPPFAADVRIADGMITEVGPGLAAKGERVFDAAGCQVTPITMAPCGGSPISTRCPATARPR